MCLQKTNAITRKRQQGPIFRIITLLLFLLMGGCASWPTYNLSADPSEESLAVLEVYICAYITSILNNSGREVYSTDDPRYKERPRLLKLKPGQYTIKYQQHFYKTTTINDQATLQMKAGHLYRFVHYSVLHDSAWLWIEDATARTVVGGIPPPADVKKGYPGLGEPMFFEPRLCSSTVLDYLEKIPFNPFRLF